MIVQNHAAAGRPALIVVGLHEVAARLAERGAVLQKLRLAVRAVDRDDARDGEIRAALCRSSEAAQPRAGPIDGDGFTETRTKLFPLARLWKSGALQFRAPQFVVLCPPFPSRRLGQALSKRERGAQP